MSEQAKTVIHVMDDCEIRVTEPIEEVYSLMGHNAPMLLTRITGHGTSKRTVVRAQAVLWLEEV